MKVSKIVQSHKNADVRADRVQAGLWTRVSAVVDGGRSQRPRAGLHRSVSSQPAPAWCILTGPVPQRLCTQPAPSCEAVIGWSGAGRAVSGRGAGAAVRAVRALRPRRGQLLSRSSPSCPCLSRLPGGSTAVSFGHSNKVTSAQGSGSLGPRTPVLGGAEQSSGGCQGALSTCLG